MRPNHPLQTAGMCVCAGILLVAATVAAPIAGTDAEAEARLRQLPSGRNALVGEGLNALILVGGTSKDRERQVVTVTGQPFAEALRVRTIIRPKDPWTIALQGTLAFRLEEGDVLLVTFWGRTVEASDETGEGAVTVSFGQFERPWTQLLSQKIGLGKEWKKYYLPVRSQGRFEPAELRFSFHLGFPPQVIELGGVEFRYFGKDVRPEELPRTKPRYAGQELSAPWRTAAADRIERLRKGDLVVTVVDNAGKPVTGAAVTAKMRKHAFPFGTAIYAPRLLDTGHTEEGKRFRLEITSLFNYAVLDGHCGWPVWEQPKERARCLEAVRWLREQGFGVRGHCLVYPTWRMLPAHLKELEKDPAALQKAILDHIRDEAGALKGQIEEWVVLNELYSKRELTNILGDGAMVEWFRAAKESDPQARLTINDNQILSSSGEVDTEHQRHYEGTIRYLIEQKAPLDGIGMQGHFGGVVTPPETLVKILDRFGKFGLPISITEFDQEIGDEELQGNYMRDFLTVVFSHPSVINFTMWGFFDGSHWKNNAPIYRKDWSLKPSGEAFKDLVFKQWWTNAEGKTDAQGEYRLRGFLGDYDLTVTHEGQTRTVQVALPAQGKTVPIRLEPPTKRLYSFGNPQNAQGFVVWVTSKRAGLLFADSGAGSRPAKNAVFR